MSSTAITVLGRVQPNYRGTYSALNTYDKLDWVVYNGSSYVCKINGTSAHSPTETGYWQLLAAKGDKGNTGDTGSFGTPTASAYSLVTGSEPTVVVTASGPDTAKVFDFQFGIPAGPVGFDAVQASATSLPASASATVEASISKVGDVTTLEFEFGIPAADGSGAKSVDGIQADAQGNITVGAISYTRTQSLSEAQAGRARTNIAALREPDQKSYGQFLQYGGDVSNPSWIAATVNEVPIGGMAGYVLRKQGNTYGWTPAYEIPSGGLAGYALVKASNTNYDVTWEGITTIAEIDEMIDG